MQIVQIVVAVAVAVYCRVLNTSTRYVRYAFDL